MQTVSDFRAHQIPPLLFVTSHPDDCNSLPNQSPPASIPVPFSTPLPHSVIHQKRKSELTTLCLKSCHDSLWLAKQTSSSWWFHATIPPLLPYRSRPYPHTYHVPGLVLRPPGNAKCGSQCQEDVEEVGKPSVQTKS